MAKVNLIFLIHALVEGALGLICMFAPQQLEATLSLGDATALLLARAFGAALLGMATASFFSYNLPDMLPCKRALAIGNLVYHGAIAFISYQSRTDASLDYTTATALMSVHLVLAGGFYVWWTATAGQVKSFTKQQRKKNW